jgi:MYXO-CTERM domain-containing protein
MTPAVVVGMPHLKQLKQADAWIRDPKTLDPNRKQTLLPQLPRPAFVPQKHMRINTPINGVTYPIPKTVKVLKTDGSTITLDLEEYLKGVLPREIGSSFPAEAQKAQAIAARTYTVQYTQGGKKAICTTTQCQVWGTTQYASTTAAVLATKGQVAVHNGSLAGGYFAASCGGSTINSEDKWNYRAFLRARPCIENKQSKCTVVCQPSTCGGGRCSSSHSLCWGIFGHRIGLCQRGAQAMGKCGKNYIDIVKHYYTGVDIANLPATTQTDDAKLARETIPGGTKMQPGQSFTKEWTMENSGTTTWDKATNYQLKRLSGETFGAADAIALGSSGIGPNVTHSFQISLKAPTAPGTYKATWQMFRDSKAFGAKVTVEIVVEAPQPTCTDNDKDGFGVGAGCTTPVDCDDNDKSVNPNATEICGNGKDDDCKDGDAQCPADCVDNDKDGYYAQSANCTKGPFDCDDNDKNVNPGAKEACGNGKDDDCKDGDAQCPANCVDKDQDGYGAGSGCPQPVDCDDNDKNVNPGAKEVCGNGKDDDCQGGDLTCGTTNPPTKKKFGETGCTSHGDCETGLCVSDSSSPAICSRSCGTGLPACPEGYSCIQGKACWPTTPTETQCRNSADCKTGQVCENLRCVTRKKGCGCSSTSGEHMPVWPLFLLLFAAFAFRLRRQVAEVQATRKTKPNRKVS